LKAPEQEIRGLSGEEICELRAADETAARQTGDAYEARAQQQHACRLGDIDVRITLGGGWKDGDRGRRSRNGLRLDGGRADAVGLARESRRTRDDADTSYDEDRSETN
jgi:hypothetical protein